MNIVIAILIILYNDMLHILLFAYTIAYIKNIKIK